MSNDVFHVAALGDEIVDVTKIGISYSHTPLVKPVAWNVNRSKRLSSDWRGKYEYPVFLL